jgi:hypothetical protein
MTHREAAEDLAEFERTGGPAFPWDGMGDDGMTLRDYFASKAMQGRLAACEMELTRDDVTNLALSSYVIADAMLKARNA